MISIKLQPICVRHLRSFRQSYPNQCLSGVDKTGSKLCRVNLVIVSQSNRNPNIIPKRCPATWHVNLLSSEPSKIELYLRGKQRAIIVPSNPEFQTLLDSEEVVSKPFRLKEYDAEMKEIEMYW